MDTLSSIIGAVGIAAVSLDILSYYRKRWFDCVFWSYTASFAYGALFICDLIENNWGASVISLIVSCMYMYAAQHFAKHASEEFAKLVEVTRIPFAEDSTEFMDHVKKQAEKGRDDS